MHTWRRLAALVFLFAALMTASAAEAPTAAGAEHAAAGATPEHSLTAFPLQVFKLGPLLITNSMMVTWGVALVLILVSQLATRRVQLVPSGLQNFVEWLVEGLYEFFGEILGPELVKKSFWFFCSIFLFILFTNWLGLLPGVGTVGYGSMHDGYFHVTRPFLRGGNADLNMTLAMALVFFFLWTVWSFQFLGVGGFLKHLFWGGGGNSGIMGLFMIAIFLFVGVIELLSIAFRPVSLSFRLYGNIFAGENILESMMTLVPALGWILPLPFYFLELLVGLVQALVFALLTSVFTALMCAHHDDSHGADHGKKQGAHAH